MYKIKLLNLQSKITLTKKYIKTCILLICLSILDIQHREITKTVFWNKNFLSLDLRGPPF